MQESAERIENKTAQFPNLLKAILAVVDDRLSTRLPATNQMVKDLLESELDFINFKNEKFLKAYNRLVNPTGETASEIRLRVSGDCVSDDGGPSKEVKCEDVKELVKSYFLAVRERMKDLIPKITVKFMIVYLKKNLQEQLLDRLTRIERLDDLMSEDECISLRRSEAEERLKELKKAILVINEVDHHRL